MKKIRVISLSFLWVLFAACKPNTGHRISTHDKLEISRGHDWHVSWVLESPTASKDLKTRIKNPTWHYSIDAGSWMSKPLTVTKISDTELLLEVIINWAEFKTGSEIQCYLEYSFDGDSSSQSGRASKRVVKIK